MSSQVADDGWTPDPATHPAQLLARLVVRRGERAQLLDEHNNAGQWVEVEDAASSGQAFFVEVAPWILALDADNPHTANAVEDIANDLADAGFEPGSQH